MSPYCGRKVHYCIVLGILVVGVVEGMVIRLTGYVTLCVPCTICTCVCLVWQQKFGHIISGCQHGMGADDTYLLKDSFLGYWLQVRHLSDFHQPFLISRPSLP